MLEQRQDGKPSQYDFASPMLRFGIGEDEPSWSPTHRTAHLDMSRGEVHVTPAQREQFTLAHPTGNRQRI